MFAKQVTFALAAYSTAAIKIEMELENYCNPAFIWGPTPIECLTGFAQLQRDTIADPYYQDPRFWSLAQVDQERRY